MSLDAGRGRDSDCPLPPAQTRARATNAHGSHLGDEHAQAIDLHALPRHCSAPMFSGAVSSIGPCLGISLADRLPSTRSAGSPLPLFADFVSTMRSLDSPRPCMEDLWLIAFSSRPAHYPLAAAGSPGSRAWSFSACLGSSTPRGRIALALSCYALLPSVLSDAVGAPEHTISELNTQPTDTPVQRFKCGLAAALTRLGARVARYAFSVRLFHSLLHAGLSRRYPDTSVRATAVPYLQPFYRAPTTSHAGRPYAEV